MFISAILMQNPKISPKKQAIHGQKTDCLLRQLRKII